MKKNISKALSMLLTLAILATIVVVPVSASEVDWKTLTGQRIELSTTTTEVEAGASVSVAVKINDPKNLKGGMYTITWDPELIDADRSKDFLGRAAWFTAPAADANGMSMVDAMSNLTTALVDEGKFIYAFASNIPLETGFPEGYGAMNLGTFKFNVLPAAAGKEVTISIVPTATYNETSSTFEGSYGTQGVGGNAKLDAPVNVTLKVAGGEPTPKDYGLFTDASQNFKVDAPVMTSNGYAIEKALGFVSGINKDVELECGTEITCEGFDDVVLEIPAANFYEASNLVKGFVAAVTSIRDTNLDKEFSARAYVIVDGKKVYAEETAKAVYGK